MTVSRRVNAKNNGMKYPLPDIYFNHLTELFLRSGKGKVGFNGIEPLTYNEIDAMLRVVKIDLLSWESDLVISMSEAYCMEIHQKDDNNVYPWLTKEVIAMNRKAISAKIAAT